MDTGTYAHSYTRTNSSHTGTQLHRYTVTPLHMYMCIQVHRYTGTHVHSGTGTQVRRLGSVWCTVCGWEYVLRCGFKYGAPSYVLAEIIACLMHIPTDTYATSAHMPTESLKQGENNLRLRKKSLIAEPHPIAREIP